MVEKISTTTFQEPIYSQNIQQFLYNHLSLKETIGCAASEHTSAFCSLLFCGVIVILRNSMQGFGDRVIPVFSSCIELAGKIMFAFVFAPMFAYWGIIWAEPMVWIAMVIPLIVKVVHVLKKEA